MDLGRELLREVRKRRPKVKCLLTSGYAPDAIGRHALEGEEGADFVQKPYSLDDLAAKLRELLDS
jgi:DNA-binding response OmpR family regulator